MGWDGMGWDGMGWDGLACQEALDDVGLIGELRAASASKAHARVRAASAKAEKPVASGKRTHSVFSEVRHA